MGSATHIEITLKLESYFRLARVFHYLIVDQRSVIHPARGANDTIATKIITEGSIALDPPGLEISLSDIDGVRGR